MRVKDFVIMDKGSTTYEIRDVTSKGRLLDSCNKDMTRVRYGNHELYSFEVTGKNKVILNIN